MRTFSSGQLFVSRCVLARGVNCGAARQCRCKTVLPQDSAAANSGYQSRSFHTCNMTSITILQINHQYTREPIPSQLSILHELGIGAVTVDAPLARVSSFDGCCEHLPRYSRPQFAPRPGLGGLNTLSPWRPMLLSSAC